MTMGDCHEYETMRDWLFKTGSDGNIYRDLLNIWQICHLWYDINPDHNEQLNIKVQQLIMIFSQWIARGEINICSENHYTYDIKNAEMLSDQKYVEKYYPDIYANKNKEPIPLHIFEENSRKLDYEMRKNKQYYDFAGDIISIYQNQQFDKNILTSVFLDCEEVQWFCEKMRMDLPGFWFDENEISEHINKIKGLQEQGENNKEIIDLNNSSDLFKTMLQIKKDIFDKPYTDTLANIKEDVENKYHLSKNEAHYICTILNKNKSGGTKPYKHKIK